MYCSDSDPPPFKRTFEEKRGALKEGNSIFKLLLKLIIVLFLIFSIKMQPQLSIVSIGCGFKEHGTL